MRPLSFTDLRKPAAERGAGARCAFDVGGRNERLPRRCGVGMTNTSLYAYVTDGRNGLRVLQLDE